MTYFQGAFAVSFREGIPSTGNAYFIKPTRIASSIDDLQRPKVEEWQQKAADANRQVRIPQRFSRCCWYHGYHFNTVPFVGPTRGEHQEFFWKLLESSHQTLQTDQHNSLESTKPGQLNPKVAQGQTKWKFFMCNNCQN